MRRILAGLALALLIASPVFGAKPSSAACSVSPDPVAVGADFTTSGSGFEPSAVFQVFVYKPSSTTTFFGFSDAAGVLVPFAFASWESGLVTVEFRPYSTVRLQQSVASCAVTVG